MRRTTDWSHRRTAAIGAACIAFGLASVAGGDQARAEGPLDLPSAFSRAFEGTQGCAAVRDAAPGAGTAVSDQKQCERRLPPCATFELPATVIAIDRGVVPDANTPVRRPQPQQSEPSEGVTLRDAFRRPVPAVYEEIARRIGTDGFNRALAAMRYGNAETGGPVERIGRGDDDNGLTLSAVEQVDFLAKLRRGELPISAEAQARTVEILPSEKIGDATLYWKNGACDGTAWSVGWVDRGDRSVIFAAAETKQQPSAEEVAGRVRRLLTDLALTPSSPPK